MATFDVVVTDSLLAPPEWLQINEGPSYVTVLFALPAVYIDDLQDLTLGTAPIPDASEVYAIFNRDPEPNEAEIPIDFPIVIDMVINDATGPEPDPNIYVNGVQARASGGAVPPGTWLAPFTGVDSSPGPHPDHRRFTITDHPVWTSEQVVTVRVFQDNSWTGGYYPDLDVTYQFTAADVLGPSIIEVDVDPVLYEANDEEPAPCWKRIRCRFDDDVVMDASEVGALNLANYTIEPLGVPSFNPTLVEIRRVYEPVGEGGDIVLSTRLVDIFTDDVLTFGAPYRVVGRNINDTSGNAYIGAPVNFTAYAPTFPDGRRFYFWEQLPGINQEMDASGDLAAFIACHQDVLNIWLCLLDSWTDILDVDVASRQFLDAMLVDLGDPFRFTDLTTAERRKLVRALFRIHRLRGTIPGIIAAVQFFLGITVTIEEFSAIGWRLGTDDELGVDSVLGTGDLRLLNTFRVISAVDLTVEQRTRLTAVVRQMKPAGKHFILVEPAMPDLIDHWEMGLSELSETAIVH